MDELRRMVKEMKQREIEENKHQILEKIKSLETITEICVYGRYWLKSQSTNIEKILLDRLKIEPPISNNSGDGHKNGTNYEIKVSMHAKQSKINFVQIRPDHDIQFYILIAFNMYEDDDIGKAYIFKIPSEDLYKLLPDYGGYAHGTKEKLGDITSENIKERYLEYALRANPNLKKGIQPLWNELLKYEVEFHPDNFSPANSDNESVYSNLHESAETIDKVQESKIIDI